MDEQIERRSNQRWWLSIFRRRNQTGQILLVTGLAVTVLQPNLCAQETLVIGSYRKDKAAGNDDWESMPIGKFAAVGDEMLKA
ncbi:hypothetical protein MKW98_022904 [Papaver atlanticum]|uniref:Uncharacterized protein n=1 Tax=Papaver atlanticum TaxID=357466 RepID=A0AAD4TIT7_9MAGN|nr:hypothetical protein MKW98_022904 [Papaver atlanticum]